jgi:diketogulonate reductase-like aldo/keto reductase
MLNLQSKVLLNNGVEMPRFGLGVYQSDVGEITENAVKFAVGTAGYNLVDTAEFYKNEADVGAGIRASKKPRESVFIVTKLFNTEAGKAGCLEVFNKSLKNLGVSYIDQYLLHAPHGGKVLECYDTLLELQKKGLLKSVGVSNFGVHHLEALKNAGRPLPAVNQIELHPWCTNEEIVKYCQKNNIGIVAYSPLAKGERLADPFVLSLAKKYNKSPAHILIRWSLDRGFIVIPKSTNPERIMDNANVFDFKLTSEEILTFDSFGRKEKAITGWDPTVYSLDKFGPLV